MTTREALEALGECGIAAAAGTDVNELLGEWGLAGSDPADFGLLLSLLGDEQESPPYDANCANVWHFDTECIEDEGSYSDIAARMSELAQGSLPLDEISDEFDFDTGRASLSFSFRNRDICIRCRLQDDWVDPGIFIHFVNLLAESDPNRIYFYLDLEGQDCIIGCVTLPEYGRLRKLVPAIRPLS